jgi:hypothetical protein
MAVKRKATTGIQDVPLDRVVVTNGWRYDDAVTQLKLESSLRRHGQLTPVVVREVGDTLQVIDGRRVVAALRTIGAATVCVNNLGAINATEAGKIMLALRLRFRTDYAKLAYGVAELMAVGETADGLASCSPYNADRITHLDMLTRFDWDQFSGEDDGQAEMNWDTTDETVTPALPDVAPLNTVSEPAPVPSGLIDLFGNETPEWVKPAKKKPAATDDMVPLF